MHILFDQHEVVLAEGSWSESFQPGDQSLEGLDTAQRAEIYEIFPELAKDMGRESYAAARMLLKPYQAQALFH